MKICFPSYIFSKSDGRTFSTPIAKTIRKSFKRFNYPSIPSIEQQSPPFAQAAVSCHHSHLKRPVQLGGSFIRHELHVAHELLEHVLQTEFPPATTRPPLWAKKTASSREVCSPSHWIHAIGISASFMDRRASNFSPQSKQAYS